MLPKKEEGIQGVSEIAITVQATPADASVFLDGKPFANNLSKEVAVGAHRLRVEKSGYTTYEKEIIVSPSKTLFPVTLTTNDPVSVILNSTPANAEIFIDGLSKGKTRKALFMYPGSYELRLMLSGYLPVNERITVSSDERQNNFTFNLVKNTGMLKIDVSPAIATVRINKEVINANELQELTPGTYQIEAEAETYYPYKGTFEIVLGQTKTEKITLTQKAGKLQFAINPPEAECVLSQNGIEKYRWTGLKIFSTIAEGTYDLTAKAQGYKSYTGKVAILENQTTVEDIQMIQESDSPEDMVLVEGGIFTMGCTSEQSDCDSDEKPVHQVTVSSFLIGKTEVTLASFEQFINETGYETDADEGGDSYVLIGSSWENKSGVNWRCDTKGNRRSDSEKLHPVIHVSWNDAVAFCNWLSEKEGLQKAYTGSGSSIRCDFTSNGYRLPTEAEWEYAARGGNKSRGYKYSGSNDLDVVGWFDNNSGNQTKEVGKKQPNELGLYDMSGNVWEWCWDWYGDYSSSSQTDPRGPNSGSFRVNRGGGWNGNARRCRVADRDGTPDDRSYDLGFRLARTR